jgi:hypothetical protein
MIIDEQATKGATRRACADVTTDRVTHLGFFEFKAVGQHDASPVFLAGHPVLDRLNIGLANTGDSNGRSSPLAIDIECNRGEERLDRIRGDHSANLPHQPAVLAAFDREHRPLFTIKLGL